MAKETNCNHVQEDIAWGRALEPAAQAHVLVCPRCQETALGFAALESTLDAAMEGEVPDHFADGVMRRIEPRSAFSLERWLDDRIQLPLRMQAAYLCGVAFVLFAFFLPSAA